MDILKKLLQPLRMDFEVSCTKRKILDISNKYILIGAAATDTNLPYGTITDDLNKIPIIHGGVNYLLSVGQDNEFGVDIQDVDKQHVNNQYVNSGD